MFSKSTRQPVFRIFRPTLRRYIIYIDTGRLFYFSACNVYKVTVTPQKLGVVDSRA